MSAHPRIKAMRERAQPATPPSAGPPGARRLEICALLLASLTVAVGLLLVYLSKAPQLREAEATLARPEQKELLNLNRVSGPQALLPLLVVLPEADREFAAKKIAERSGSLPNVGALARLRVPFEEVEADPQLDYYRTLLDAERLKNEGKPPGRASTGISLLTAGTGRALERVNELLVDRPKGGPEAKAAPELSPEERERLEALRLRLNNLRDMPLPFGQLKPSFVVRTPDEFRHEFWLRALLFFAAFYLVHAVWRWRGFGGDELLLPVTHLLSGVGFILMLSLRDPLRDNLNFVTFTEGVLWGCAALLGFSLFDFRRAALRDLSFIPLALSFGLSVLLLTLGTAPEGSQAKVNLFGFQPVEVIKRLLVFFYAGYFARNWEFLRELKEGRAALPRLARRFAIPRLDYFLPLIVCMAVAMLFFVLQQDLGPALVMYCTFLALYGVARRRKGLVAVGLLMMLAGFAVSYLLGRPPTIVTRVEMWVSPWRNLAPNGNQVAHSFWAFASGGVTGSGLGLGSSGVIPAGHTDMIISSAGEELGFAGVLSIFALYAVLAARGMRAALRAQGDYPLFLALGLTAMTALEVLLITGGILGLVPLSGVVSPFLSYGKTALIANFAAVGILLSVSAQGGAAERQLAFRAPSRKLALVLVGIGAVVVLKAAYVQVVAKDDFTARGSLVRQGDEVIRYEYNPRLTEFVRRLRRATIRDRNGIPLATSDCASLAEHRRQYAELGVDIDRVCARRQARYYPFGGVTYHLLGDRRAPNWGADNTSFAERTYEMDLQGFVMEGAEEAVIDLETLKPVKVYKYDYDRFASLLRSGYRADDQGVAQLLGGHDVKLTVDAALQVRVARILEERMNEFRRQLKKGFKGHGAATVIDPASGELLASVSYPWPGASAADYDTAMAARSRLDPESLIDRARWGFYPPGSTFKLVTAVAALRRDPSYLDATPFECVELHERGGRAGIVLGRWGTIRDDESDEPHGRVSMETAIVQSCNAYFSQLADRVGPAEMAGAARDLFGVSVSLRRDEDPVERFRRSIKTAFGQEVVATPLEMARVAGAIANDGLLQPMRGESRYARGDAKVVVPPETARRLAGFMRGVVTSGTARRLTSSVPIAGKTGTAQVQRAPAHSWFVGFAPYELRGTRRLAFGVVVENSGVGAVYAGSVAQRIADGLHELRLIR